MSSRELVLHDTTVPIIRQPALLRKISSSGILKEASSGFKPHNYRLTNYNFKSLKIMNQYSKLHYVLPCYLTTQHSRFEGHVLAQSLTHQSCKILGKMIYHFSLRFICVHKGLNRLDNLSTNFYSTTAAGQQCHTKSLTFLLCLPTQRT